MNEDEFRSQDTTGKKTIAQKIDEVTAVAASPGNAHADDYLRGMANGLLLAQSIMRGTEVVYIEPDVIDRFDYMAEADKTCSIVFRPEQVNREELVATLDTIASACRTLNIAKKLFFRGRTNAEIGVPMPEFGLSVAMDFDGPEDHGIGKVDMLHGLVGAITEAGEMAEALLHFFKTGAFDETNINEECGDVTWYVARCLRGISASRGVEVTFEAMQRANIDKLHGRHGEAFDVFRDANRDLVAERAQLETAIPMFPDANNGFGGGDETVGQYARRMTGADRPQDAASPPQAVNVGIGARKAPGQEPAGVVERLDRKPIGDCEGIDC